MMILELNENHRSAHQQLIDRLLGEQAAERVAQIEAYIRVYLQETGATIDQVELCQEMRGNTTVMYFRKREVKD